jgi:TonB dependent receptor/Carboxypeptidase regulatory-like domain
MRSGLWVRARGRIALVTAAFALAMVPGLEAQPRRASIHGDVAVVGSAPLPDVTVTLSSEDGQVLATVTTDAAGQYEIRDVAPGRYVVRGVNGTLEDRVPVTIDLVPDIVVSLRLTPPRFPDDYIVFGYADEFTRIQSALDGEILRDLPARLQTRALPQAIASLPGFAEEDNGLLHVRGVDDGVLYVEDGIPIYDRLDVAFGIPPGLADLGAVAVTTGHTPAAFGLKAGAVVEITAPPASEDWRGQVQGGGGSSELAGGAVSGGGPAGAPIDIFASVAAERSSRFLDPVHPDNLHNTGGVAGASLRALAAPTSTSQVTLNMRAGRSRFDVPHAEPAELAGQDQRQRTTQSSQSLGLRQSVGTAGLSLAGYHRRIDARLLGSEADTPVTADSARRHDRLGLLGSATVTPGRHTLTIGGEVSRVAITEDFRFAVTDPDADDLSDAAAAFTPARPFVFAGDVARPQWSAYASDRFALGTMLIDAGLRVDHTELLVPTTAWSPRIGLALTPFGRSATLRASFNRFFQPPQAEHLLLSSSEDARALSPFVDDDDDGGGGAELLPERQTAWELGWEQRLGRVTLDIAGWGRRVENYTDPNVFFGTTIVFPNSVAKGTARGLDVRLQMPSVRGVTATAAYTLSKVEQEGPINGGLFLEDEIADIGPGDLFTPDHDQRHTASATVTWVQPVGRWAATAQARYASGTPVELGDLDDDDAEELAERPGAELVDFDRGRVTPRLVVDLSASLRLRRTTWGEIGIAASLLNAFNRAYAFNFGNPFSGTHFGAPRQIRADLRIRIN